MKLPFLALTAVLLLSACSEVRSPTQPTTTPTPLPTTPPTTPVSGANWIADATVQSSTGGGCGWGTAVGDTGVVSCGVSSRRAIR
jgi:hypothetical protein